MGDLWGSRRKLARGPDAIGPHRETPGTLPPSRAGARLIPRSGASRRRDEEVALVEDIETAMRPGAGGAR